MFERGSNMIEILSKKHQIQLSIMILLLERDYITLGEMEDIVGVSTPTLLTYLQNLEEETDFFEIQRNKNYIFPIKTHRINYSTIYHFFYRKSLNLQFIEIVFLNPFISKEELQNKMKISKSTLDRIKKHLERPLKSYNVAISDSPYHFEGDFHSVCAFIVSYMYEKYCFTQQFINQQENTILDRLIEPFFELQQIEGFQDIERLKTWIWGMIKLTRHYPNRLHGQVKGNHQFHGFVISEKQFESVFSVKFYGYCYHTLSQLYAFLSIDQSIKDKTEKKQAITDFVNSIYNYFSVDSIFESDALVESILQLHRGKNYILNNEKERFVIEFFLRNGCFSQRDSKFIELSLRKLNDRINDPYLYFEILYILLTHEKKLLHLFVNQQEKKSVAVLYTYDKEHSYLVAERLSEIFSHYLKFEVIEELTGSALEESCEDFDFCITNLPIIQHSNCIVTDIFPNDGDIEYLDLLFRKSIIQPFIEELKMYANFNLK